MTWSAAFPGVAVRVLRAAVGRRALQVGLLVGGLFVLGFLCGEQAQAADGTGELPGTTVGQSVNLPSAPTATGTDADRNPDPDPAKHGTPDPVAPEAGNVDTVTHPSDDTVLRPVTEDVIGAVTDGVVRPVGDLVAPVGNLVETVTTGLTETVGIPAQPTLPEWPSFPESPSWPTLPTVPGAPTVPGLPGTPVETLPVPAPATSAPQQPQSGEQTVESPAGDKGSAHGGAVYGPRFAGHATVAGGAVRGPAHRTNSTSTAHAPAQQAPSDNPGGVLGGKSAVDNGSSRHGDAHAITPGHRAPLRLVPGAAASVEGAGTRDRHRDIPVFPG
ncbi:hypothetical protein M2164_003472 [Streptomyces sp. SAI-208]|uniref:hypothetical protein n=1 Tax=Streptomyces sp. SAI-208 TaxID=2940550 RepID=UPI00247404AE|nr:hypothetical protein [Streptomyces sp. SAI-208]MDH6607837.1 hypothetical protein [Streptomyces sp. SAI-208]